LTTLVRKVKKAWHARAVAKPQLADGFRMRINESNEDIALSFARRTQFLFLPAGSLPQGGHGFS
jgi:hypothetical protein